MPTIPTLTLAGALLVTYVPIPTLIGMLIWSGAQLSQADFYARLVVMSGEDPNDPQHLRVRVKHIASGIFLVAATVVAHGLWVHHIVNHRMLCED